jgi:K+-transporting ATPase ATPase C chain
MRPEWKTALRLFVIFTFLTGVIYPLVITGIAHVAIPYRAHGSLIVRNGTIIGSELIGQMFTSARYFHGRPSAVDYDAAASGASNYGPTNSRLLELVRMRVRRVREENGLASDQPIPADLALASGSGLDPHISVEAATLQVKRVAEARGLAESVVGSLVEEHIETLGVDFWEQARVNVLKLNLALDELGQ